jgi:PAS domain S-box-containing protein
MFECGKGCQDIKRGTYSYNIDKKKKEVKMDADELERCREELKREKEVMSSLLDSIPTPMYIMTPNREIISTNNRCEDFFDRSKEEIGKVLLEDLYEGEEMRDAFEGAKRTGFETCEATLNNGKKAILNFAPIRDENGKITNMIGTAQDISELNERERKLEREIAFLDPIIDNLDQIIDSMGDALLVCDDHLMVTKVNKAMERISRPYRYETHEIIGKKITKLPIMTKEVRKMAEDIFRRVINGEVVSGVEVPLAAKDGEKMVLSATASMWKDKDGNIMGGIVLIRDITEVKKTTSEIARVLSAMSKGDYTKKVDLTGMTGDLKRMAENINETMEKTERVINEVKNSRETLSRLMEENPIPMAITDKGMNILDVNKAYLEATGYSREDVISKNMRRDFEVVETIERVNLKEAVEKKKKTSGINVVNTPNGRLTFIVGALPYKDISTGRGRVLMTFTDITELWLLYH